MEEFDLSRMFSSTIDPRRQFTVPRIRTQRHLVSKRPSYYCLIHINKMCVSSQVWQSADSWVFFDSIYTRLFYKNEKNHPSKACLYSDKTNAMCTWSFSRIGYCVRLRTKVNWRLGSMVQLNLWDKKNCSIRVSGLQQRMPYVLTWLNVAKLVSLGDSNCSSAWALGWFFSIYRTDTV